MGLDHGPPNFCQKVWFLIMGTMVIIPIWVLIMYPVKTGGLRNRNELKHFRKADICYVLMYKKDFEG